MRTEAWGREGYRVLGLAVKRVGPKVSFSREDEAGLAFAGFMLFMDPPKLEYRKPWRNCGGAASPSR